MTAPTSTAFLPMAAVLLCGGQSSRMGFDKALLEVEGVPLVRLLAERLGEVCDPILLAPGQRGRLAWLGLAEVEDAVAGAGPLGAIVAALGASPHDLLAVVAVDMPSASPTLLRYLADRLGSHQAAVPEGPRGPEPAHAVYSRGALPVLERRLLGGRRSLTGALDELDVLTVREAELLGAGFGPSFAANVNEPDDLWMLRR